MDNKEISRLKQDEKIAKLIAILVVDGGCIILGILLVIFAMYLKNIYIF